MDPRHLGVSYARAGRCGELGPPFGNKGTPITGDCRQTLAHWGAVLGPHRVARPPECRPRVRSRPGSCVGVPWDSATQPHQARSGTKGAPSILLVGASQGNYSCGRDSMIAKGGSSSLTQPDLLIVKYDKVVGGPPLSIGGLTQRSPTTYQGKLAPAGWEV